MGLFDIFTGKPAKDAAAQTRNYLTGVQNTGTNAINTGLNSATGYVQDAGDSARSSLTDAYGNATGAVNAGYGDAINYVSGGTAAASPYYDAARAGYGSLSALGSKYGDATTMALNGLGVNGQGGTDAARAAFTAGPAYNFNMEQGLDAINRRRAAGGMLDSGNADRDSQKFGAGLASNEYNTWMNNLLGFTNPELAATSGAATGTGAVNMAQAGMTNNNALTQAQYANSRGGMLADLSSRYGTGTAGSYTGEGQSLANLASGAAKDQVSLGLGVAQPYSSTYKNEADAAMAGSGALWNLGLGAANLGLRASGVGGFGSPTYPTRT